MINVPDGSITVSGFVPDRLRLDLKQTNYILSLTNARLSLKLFC